MLMLQLSTIKELNVIGDFLARIAENSDSVYWLSTPDFSRIIYVSPAYEQIWGRSRRDLYQHPDSWSTFLHPDDMRNYDPIERMIEQISELGEAARFEENYRIKRPNGEIRWIIDRGYPVFTEEGLLCGVSGVAIDVTKEREGEEELRNAKLAAEAANKAKSIFLATISHELRTPMNGIIGLTEILANSQLSPSNLALVNDIHNVADHLQFLINDLLSIASIEAGKIRLLFKPTNITEMARQTVDHMLYRLQYKKIQLQVDIDDDVPNIVVTDPSRVRQIFINLLDNAIKYTHTGKINVHVSAENWREGHFELVIAVADTGIGINQKDLERIFQRFVQTNDTPYQREYAGLGLGLSICKELVQLLKGSITVSSQVGKGSTFTFKIPVKLSEEIQGLEEAVTSVAVDRNHFRVLIVEDEPINQKILRLMFDSELCHYDLVGTGEQAIAFALKNDYDIIFMDIQLPDMTGVEVTEKLRKSGLQIPIIATTAHAFEEEIRAFLQLGMDDVLTKPFTRDQIFNKMQKWCG